ncbi:hypothetical protein SGLAD_v1c03420 [Spiroplasma gladiatoris]|uniref:DUF3196 domain-containing protein n=1 Tax=Spiroplasma gladiatoris TaxID=2143 RepID=A0A4P7AHD6_9MOLU|nr:DUF3196 family protein [Spiroplasma gladiatoris]QBQ07541.1 hypothetical protein SGLAD_v1c03420 [Spiroplasma gladiatoris]
MQKNYYELTLENLVELLGKNRFEEALIIINDELSAPYIPADFEKNLQIIKNEINNKLKTNQKESHNMWGLNKVVDIMKQSLDQEMHLIAFDNLRNLNARKILNHIKEYLLSKDIKNEYKTFLLMVLIEQKLDENLVVKKQEKIININPANYNLKESQDFLKTLEFKLSNLVYDKDPSFFSICKHVANTYFYNIFPDFELNQFKIEDIVACIYLYSQNALGLEIDKQLNEKIDFNYDNAMLLLDKFKDLI